MSSIACTPCVLVFAVSLLCHNFVEGRRAKGTLKTIRSEGEIIDCVVVYQQSALNHPLLTNHKIQMKPTSRPSGIGSDNSEAELDPFWRRVSKWEGVIFPVKAMQKQVTLDMLQSWMTPTHEDADLQPNATTVTKPSCYDLLFGPPNATYGSYFYYGAGFSDNCQ
ncbi:Neprosin activation peptide [Dillenia turbinata]|uniref:Neprosin activation peptide n=1 Tax=Dillenia turbinata TaxID=194707 RepID=A0AAN8UXV3_9MAGN